ncbi:hypothetical protein RI129_002403 [Pyrocoelia pectoralis]|uniref:Uncharacterized protein n=1 Tax=Pyrocoelia pectoralis TaxID=417401 RepID=A0AAN7ZT09_9COLE
MVLTTILKCSICIFIFSVQFKSYSTALCRTTNDHKNHTCEGFRFREIVLSRSTRLQLLRTRIFNCKETDVKEGALVFPNLENLTVSCGSIQNLDEKAFLNFNNLQELDLSYNQLSKISNQVFRPLGNLRTLNLTGNSFEDLPQTIFDGLNGLKELFLSHNKINNFHVKVFDAIRAVEKVSLDNNLINFLPGRLLTKLRKLQYLDLSNNYIENVGEVFVLAYNLQYLNLSHNVIEDLPLRLFQTTRLEILDLSNNKLSIIYEDALPFKTLKKLYLQNNQISLFDVGGMNMEYMPLRLLNIENNRLVFLENDFIKTASSLTELYIFKNPWDCTCFQEIEKIHDELIVQPEDTDGPVCVYGLSNDCNINKSNLTAYYRAFVKQLEL